MNAEVREQDLRNATFRPSEGVWISYYPDWSGWEPHETELDALRCAVENSQVVLLVPWGITPKDALARLQDLPF